MLGKVRSLDSLANDAERTREFYRQQGRDEIVAKIREASYDLGDLSVTARVLMLLESVTGVDDDR